MDYFTFAVRNVRTIHHPEIEDINMATKTKNVTVTELTDGRRVLFSYGVAVAAFIPAGHVQFTPANDAPLAKGCIALDHRFSVTTSKHVNQWTENRAVRVSPASFAALIAPVAPNFPAGVL